MAESRWIRPPSDTERTLTSAIAREFDRMRREGQLDDYPSWVRVFALEAKLRAEERRLAEGSAEKVPPQ